MKRALLIATLSIISLGLILWLGALDSPKTAEAPTAEPSLPHASRFGVLPTPPHEVKAIYATAATVSSPKRLEALIRLIEATELNALVVNVKDGDGVYVGEGMARVVETLRARGVYPIARIVVFQDNDLAVRRPDLALKTADGALWRGRGYAWVDPASREVWDYNTEVSLRALDLGFGELNFDYIRFPSDGKIEDIVYPTPQGTSTKTSTIRAFADYLRERVRALYPAAVLSIDLFAESFLTDGDLGIGQRVIELADAFDILAPMAYPSHYAPGHFGFQNPAEGPYEVVRGTLEAGRARFSRAGKDPVVRPWLQDFNLGAVYDARMVREEIRAVADAGLTNGWMVWNPWNVYDPAKFLPE